VWAGVLGSLAVLGVAVFVLDARRASGPSDAARPSPDTPAAAPAAEPRESSSQPFSGVKAFPREATPEDPVPYIEGELYGALDLGEVRAALPDNLFWELGAPTKDPEEIEAREQEKARRNEEYGRVLSGDASEEEVNAYYDYRERLSTDYLEFAAYLHRRFSDKLSDQFTGLLELAIKLNKERLAQIPADRDDALQRSRERAKIREEWQREQAEFESARREKAR
jgi:hypothetical protein